MTKPTEDVRQQVRSTTARSRELGAELRRVRKRAGRGGAAACKEIEWSQAKLSKLESGRRGTSEADIATLLGLYRADKATRARILDLFREPERDHFTRAHGDEPPDEVLPVRMHEALARTLHCYEPLVVPRLLQTESYAMALLDPAVVTGDHHAAWLVSHTDRQKVLGGASAPETVIFLHETALSLVVGDADVMHDQCMNLGFLADRARLSLRVVPLSAGGCAALRHPCTRLTFTAPLEPLVYTEIETATVFSDHHRVTAAVQRKFETLNEVALDALRSRAAIGHWADVHGRVARPDGDAT